MFLRIFLNTKIEYILTTVEGDFIVGEKVRTNAGGMKFKPKALV